MFFKFLHEIRLSGSNKWHRQRILRLKNREKAEGNARTSSDPSLSSLNTMAKLGFLYLCVFGAKIITSVLSMAIDEIISNAANTNSKVAPPSLPSKDGDVKMELDMILTTEQWEETQQLEDSRSRHKRKAIPDNTYRWTDGVIPYKITPEVFESDELEEIFKAMNEWSMSTCISFRPALLSDTNYIVLDDDLECSSHVGLIGGSQTISLAKDCRTKEVIVHELGHAVGFYHEPDRDNYVKILWKNIETGHEDNFIKHPKSHHFGIRYDYRSIMHYGRKFFTSNGKDTILTKNERYQDVIGTATGLSERDILLVNHMYYCDNLCANDYSDCGYWSSQGYCWLVWEMCPKACGVCT